MAIDFTDFENTLQTKLDAVTDPKEMLLLGKAVESTIGSITLSDLQNFGDSNYARLDGVTFTGEINEAFTTVTSSTGATTVDCTDGNNFAHTLTEDTTFSFTNAPAAGVAYAFTLEIVQDSGGSGYTVTWPSSVVFPDATAPTLSSAADAIDIFVFYTNDGGTTWYGFIAGQAMG